MLLGGNGDLTLLWLSVNDVSKCHLMSLLNLVLKANYVFAEVSNGAGMFCLGALAGRQKEKMTHFASHLTGDGEGKYSYAPSHRQWGQSNHPCALLKLLFPTSAV